MNLFLHEQGFFRKAEVEFKAGHYDKALTSYKVRVVSLAYYLVYLKVLISSSKMPMFIYGFCVGSL